MRFGFGLPQMASVCNPDAIVAVAQRAEQLGFDDLWLADFTLFPLKPRAPYPVDDGTLPDLYKRVLDPLETLTFAAAQTRRIGRQYRRRSSVPNERVVGPSQQALIGGTWRWPSRIGSNFQLLSAAAMFARAARS